MVAAGQPSAKLIYLADALRARGGARLRHSGIGEPSTRAQVAAMVVTVFLVGLGWIAAQGLDDSDRCPIPRHFACFR